MKIEGGMREKLYRGRLGKVVVVRVARVCAANSVMDEPSERATWKHTKNRKNQTSVSQQPPINKT